MEQAQHANGRDLKGRNLAFLGAGNMAEAILQGVISKRIADPSHITASDVLGSRRDYIYHTYGVRGEAENARLVDEADVIVIAVKPQVIDNVLAEARPASGPEKLFISIAAGVSSRSIRDRLEPGSRVVRVIPNTPVMVMEGTTCIASDGNIPAEDLATVQAIFESVGRAFVIEEKLMDVATGLSGSGPAYVFLMIEALADGAVRMGMPRDVAIQAAAQTLLGAAKMLLETGKHPGKLKDMVTSPAGTTIEGLHQLETGGVRAALMNAVAAATRRSEELGKS